MSKVICENPNCIKEFEKSNGEINKSKHHYCSSSCAAKVNNKKHPKRHKEGTCAKCGISIPKKNKYCKNCNPFKVDYSKVTLDEIRARRKDSQKHVRIRELARKIYNNLNRSNYCERCKYKLHYDVCHIKPIYKFSGDTPISIINASNNLIALCKNCHWELDNGYLSLDFPEFDRLHL